MNDTELQDQTTQRPAGSSNKPGRVFKKRLLLAALVLLPLTMLLFPPKLSECLRFHAQDQPGTLTLYSSDDPVYYNQKVAFSVLPGNTSATNPDFHEDCRIIRISTNPLGEIKLDGLSFYLYGIPVYSLSPQQIKANINYTSHMSAEVENGSLNLKIYEVDGYITMKPLTIFSLRVWGLYFAYFYLITLLFVTVIHLLATILGTLKKEHDHGPNILLYNAYFADHWILPIGEMLFLSLPAAALLIGAFSNSCMSTISYQYYLLNYFLMLGIELVLRGLIARTLAEFMVTLPIIGVYIVNYYVYLFRGRPILPWDLNAIHTALSVANKYTITVPTRILIAGICFILMIVLITVMCLKPVRKRDTTLIGPAGDNIEAAISASSDSLGSSKAPVKKRSIKKILIRRVSLVGVGLLALVLTFSSPYYRNAKARSWEKHIVLDYHRQGFPITFLKFVQSYQVKEPDGYGKKALNKIYQENSGANALDADVDHDSITHPTRIIQVMVESMSEISYANSYSAVDTLPYYNSLKENTVRGDLYVSVRGGGTCNTEFETLTGNPMAFLPANTYPYQGYLKRDTVSLATYFKNLGYDTAALHLNDAGNWNRKTVYPYLSLQPFYSIADFPNVATLRGYATDQADVDTLKTIDASMEGPRYLFNVTMQDHGGYTPTADLPLSVDLSQYEVLGGDLTSAEIYDTLIKLTDSALKDLIESYKNDPEPTMIIIYGDHQPNLGGSVDDYLLGSDADMLDYYKTEFVIWTNYPIESKDVGAMSANYMPYLVLSTAGFPLTPYWSLAGRCFEKYPVLTSYGAIDSNGTEYTSVDSIPDDDGLLAQYRIAEYNNLFDKHRMNKLFDPVSQSSSSN